MNKSISIILAILFSQPLFAKSVKLAPNISKQEVATQWLANQLNALPASGRSIMSAIAPRMGDRDRYELRRALNRLAVLKKKNMKFSAIGSTLVLERNSLLQTVEIDHAKKHTVVLNKTRKVKYDPGNIWLSLTKKKRKTAAMSFWIQLIADYAFAATDDTIVGINASALVMIGLAESLRYADPALYSGDIRRHIEDTVRDTYVGCDFLDAKNPRIHGHLRSPGEEGLYTFGYQNNVLSIRPYLNSGSDSLSDEDRSKEIRLRLGTTSTAEGGESCFHVDAVMVRNPDPMLKSVCKDQLLQSDPTMHLAVEFVECDECLTREKAAEMFQFPGIYQDVAELERSARHYEVKLLARQTSFKEEWQLAGLLGLDESGNLKSEPSTLVYPGPTSTDLSNYRIDLQNLTGSIEAVKAQAIETASKFENHLTKSIVMAAWLMQQCTDNNAKADLINPPYSVEMGTPDHKEGPYAEGRRGLEGAPPEGFGP